MLEDDFSDILRKALRGQKATVEQLARKTGIVAEAISSWLDGSKSPSDAEARAIGTALRLDPGKLADAAAHRWEPTIGLPLDVKHHPQAPHPSNGYLFVLKDGKTAALVDPAGIAQNLLHAIGRGPYALRYILITHKHADHCDATADVAAAFPDAQIVMHRADVSAIGTLAARTLPVVDGDELPFGEETSIRMLHTPGHTDGSSSYLFRSSVFTGDTLFAGSVGGAFGEVTTYDDILTSVRFKLFTLDDTTVVMPGHGPPTTIGEEKKHNPFFLEP